MAEPTKSLQMTFATANGKEGTMTISDPKADLNAEQVQSAMNDMVASTVFVNKHGQFTRVVSADMITRTVDNLFDNNKTNA